MSFVLQVYCDPSDPCRADRSVPYGLIIKESQIPGAGSGVWADMYLPKAVRFGPYEGEIVREEDEAHESGYCWQVST